MTKPSGRASSSGMTTRAARASAGPSGAAETTPPVTEPMADPRVVEEHPHSGKLPAARAEETPLTASDLTRTLQAVLPNLVQNTVATQLAQERQRAQVAEEAAVSQQGPRRDVEAEPRIEEQDAEEIDEETEPPAALLLPVDRPLIGERGLPARHHSNGHWQVQIDYRRYRLRRRDANLSDARNFAKMRQNLSEAVSRASPAHRVNVDDFPVSMLVVLRALATAADIQGLSEGDAFAALPYILPSSAARALEKATQSVVEEDPELAGFQGTVVGYCTAVQFLLAKYCSDGQLAVAARSVFDRERAQGPMMGTEPYEKAIHQHADRFGALITERERKEAFLLGLRPETQNLIVGLSGESSWAEIRQRVRPADLLMTPKRPNSGLYQKALAQQRSMNVVTEPEPHLVVTQNAERAQGSLFDEAVARAVDEALESRLGGPVLSEEEDILLVAAGSSTTCYICYRQGHMAGECQWVPSAERDEWMARRQRFLNARRPRTHGSYATSTSRSVPSVPSVGTSTHSANDSFDRRTIPSAIDLTEPEDKEDGPPSSPKNQ